LSKFERLWWTFILSWWSNLHVLEGQLTRTVVCYGFLKGIYPLLSLIQRAANQDKIKTSQSIRKVNDNELQGSVRNKVVLKGSDDGTEHFFDLVNCLTF
jgi:hypothetical protein